MKDSKPQRKLPSTEEIHKKIKLSYELLHAAFEIKRHQLEKKHPNTSEKELNHKTMALIEAGLK